MDPSVDTQVQPKSDLGPERDENGQLRRLPDHLKSHLFKPGNKLAGGQAIKRRQVAFRATLTKCVTKAELRALGRRLLVDALKGDNVAAKLLLGYLCGEPSRELEVTGGLTSTTRTWTLADLIEIARLKKENPQVFSGDVVPVEPGKGVDVK